MSIRQICVSSQGRSRISKLPLHGRAPSLHCVWSLGLASCNTAASWPGATTTPSAIGVAGYLFKKQTIFILSGHLIKVQAGWVSYAMRIYKRNTDVKSPVTPENENQERYASAEVYSAPSSRVPDSRVYFCGRGQKRNRYVIWKQTRHQRRETVSPPGPSSAASVKKETRKVSSSPGPPREGPNLVTHRDGKQKTGGKKEKPRKCIAVKGYLPPSPIPRCPYALPEDKNDHPCPTQAEAVAMGVATTDNCEKTRRKPKAPTMPCHRPPPKEKRRNMLNLAEPCPYHRVSYIVLPPPPPHRHITSP